jgi:translation initiation factor 2-alpha kinase 4
VQLGKQYPYVTPAIHFKNVKGLSSKEEDEMMVLLVARANECALSGSVMMIELVQVVEDFLVRHNHDPNMSAWEQMKAREANELKQRQRLGQEQDEVLRNLMLQESATGDPDESPSGLRRLNTIGGEVERELVRQVEALRMAGAKRRQNDVIVPSAVTADNVEDDEDDGFEEDETPVTGSSRYQTDFIELGLLGRGGGGEVVKVRNRLDRRIYAVKKIMLESEEGKDSAYAAIQNRKLRREVTTISRITHKNIVRYYQAWVEGGENPEQTDEGKATESNKNELEKGSSSENDASRGWWTSSPLIGGIVPGRTHGHDTANLLDSISQAWNTADSGSSSSSQFSNEYSQEVEMNHDFNNPLMVGMGFQDAMYNVLANKRIDAGLTSPESDEVWDESSVKVDASVGQRILYIQMEYCNSTLRKVIDEAREKPIEETEKFRMVHQIVEALVYLHGQNLIHRDLVCA